MSMFMFMQHRIKISTNWDGHSGTWTRHGRGFPARDRIIQEYYTITRGISVCWRSGGWLAQAVYRRPPYAQPPSDDWLNNQFGLLASCLDGLGIFRGITGHVTGLVVLVRYGLRPINVPVDVNVYLNVNVLPILESVYKWNCLVGSL